jgi:hypothetical protein
LPRPSATVQARHVKHPIDEAWLKIEKNRRDILNALSAIIRAWADAGQPLATQNLRLGYEAWCAVFGGLTIFSEFGDPLAFPEDSDDEEDIDTENVDMRSLVGLLAESITSGDERHVEYTFQQVVNIVQENELFDWLIDGKEVAEHEASTGALIHKDFILKSDSKSKFGKLLKRYMPYSGELQGARYRLFRIGKGDHSFIHCLFL